MQGNIAIIDDDASVRDSLREMLEIREYQVETFDRAEKFLRSKKINDFDCLLVDVKMPGISGIDLLEQIQQKNIFTPAIVITGHGDIETAVQAMKKGAYDFQEKPFEKQVMLSAISRAVEKSMLTKETISLKKEVLDYKEKKENNYGIIGKSNAIQQVRKKILQYADAPSSVLITGETGTGKELVARALHFCSQRRKEKFVPINMATLLESTYYNEIFGHEKGSFTGAIGSHDGKFQYAHKGTIFLDEIDSMPLQMQAVILRVLEEKTFTRMGSNIAQQVDVRVIAATNQNIHELVEKNMFRRDLFHRINILNIHIPPIRERIEDISFLIHHFLQQCCSFYNREPLTIHETILQKMKHHEWKGNVRELKNTIESMILSTEEDIITQWQTPFATTNNQETTAEIKSLQEEVEKFEYKYIKEILQKTQGNLKKTAQILQISPRTLFDKMKKLDLQKENFKECYFTDKF